MKDDKATCGNWTCPKKCTHGLDVKVVTDKAISRLSGKFCKKHFMENLEVYSKFIYAYDQSENHGKYCKERKDV